MYMSISANGLIARPDGSVDWIGEASWKRYVQITKNFDAIIIGRKTFEVMTKDEFAPDKQYVVLSKQEKQNPASNIKFSNKKPEQILEELKASGVNTVCICGGGETNSVFLKESLVYELFLDIQPVVLGKGIKLFQDEEFESNLELVSVDKISDDEVSLHYKIRKQPSQTTYNSA